MKKTMKAVAAAALTVVGLVASSVASANTVLPPLELRLNGKAVYDPVANLTWLQDANYAKTSGWEVTNWAQAKTLVGNLDIDGVTGWRLPGGPMVFGYNQTASEMGNLFYNVLGGTWGGQIAFYHNANFDLFQNIDFHVYWSGVETNATVGPPAAWAFRMYDGLQEGIDTSSAWFVWPVHDGDVGASPVPLPATLFLLAPALGGISFVRRRAT